METALASGPTLGHWATLATATGAVGALDAQACWEEEEEEAGQGPDWVGSTTCSLLEPKVRMTWLGGQPRVTSRLLDLMPAQETRLDSNSEF